MYNLTVFNAPLSNDKVPSSPYKDKTFVFKSVNIESLEDCYRCLTNNWVLSNSFNIDNKILRRNSKSLEAYVTDSNIMVLDLDDINNENDFYSVLNFFKDNDYRVVLGKSRSFNGLDNFRIKGFLVMGMKNTPDNVKNHIQFLNTKIGDYCKVDPSVVSITSYQAPTSQTEILYLNDDGEEFITEEQFISTEVYRNRGINTEAFVTNKVLNKCFSIYEDYGFKVVSSFVNDNNSVNFKHSSEVKSVGGFFMFLDSPFIMRHNNDTRNISIWDVFKKTVEGKEFLKLMFAEQQKDYIKDNTLYKDETTINDRFINIENINSKIDKFLRVDNSVIKIKSAMGTAKSSVIDEVIKRTDKRVLIISPRISVALDYASKYGIKTYLDEEEDAYKQGDSLIVQMDSLYKYNLKFFDIVILDEFMSLILQSRSELSKARNFNLTRFNALLKSEKQLVIADAFLTGYENTLLNEHKSIIQINNVYRDKVSMFKYKHREMFLQTIIETAKNKSKGESISCSIMSTNVLKTFKKELEKENLTVIVLSADTPDNIKDKIYNAFEKEESVWDVILYSPTLTVGVSNLNNVVHQFHYDTGNSADVISSLQMIKRARKATVFHLYIKESQKFNPTNEEVLNSMSEIDIINFYTGREATLLIEADKEGNFILSDIGRFSNKIEVLYNILENNHKSAFELLLGEQFDFEMKEINTNSGTVSVHTLIKEHKEQERLETVDMIESFIGVDYSEEHVNEINNKTIELSHEEKVSVILRNIENEVTTEIDRNTLIELTEFNIMSNNTALPKIKRLAEVVYSDSEYINDKLSKIVSMNINSNTNKEMLEFYMYWDSLKLTGLDSWYSANQIKAIDNDMGLGNRFKKFLIQIGYERNEGRYELKVEYEKFYKYFKPLELK